MSLQHYNILQYITQNKEHKSSNTQTLASVEKAEQWAVISVQALQDVKMEMCFALFKSFKLYNFFGHISLLQAGACVQVSH